MPTLPLADAAPLLGIHASTLRRRIKRGELPELRDDEGRYLVDVDRARATPTQVPPPPTQSSTQPPTLELAERLDRLERALLEDLAAKDAQIAEKDRQLAERAREVEQLHVLLQRALEQRPVVSLPAPVEDRPADEAIQPRQRRRSWRSWLVWG
jgi:hypothetical protein